MKIRRLICLLLVIVLLMSCFWILADMPAFTAEGAFHRAERRSFLQESTFLGVDFLGKTHVSGSGIPSGSLSTMPPWERPIPPSTSPNCGKSRLSPAGMPTRRW